MAGKRQERQIGHPWSNRYRRTTRLGPDFKITVVLADSGLVDVVPMKQSSSSDDPSGTRFQDYRGFSGFWPPRCGVGHQPPKSAQNRGVQEAKYDKTWTAPRGQILEGGGSSVRPIVCIIWCSVFDSGALVLCQPSQRSSLHKEVTIMALLSLASPLISPTSAP